MFCPIIESTEVVYSRALAASWAGNPGELPTLFQANAGRLLSAIVSEVAPDKALVLDFAGMAEIDDHACWALGQSIASTDRRILITNYERLQPMLAKELPKPPGMFDLDGSGPVLVFGSSPVKATQVKATLRKTNEAQARFVRKTLKSCFASYPNGKLQRLPSTPLLANGVFDAVEIITDPNAFCWMSIFLTESVERLLESEEPDLPVLLAVSMKAAPFAVAVSQLSMKGLEVELIDHLGPGDQLVQETFLEPPFATSSYLLIGDFVLGGTELKVAQAFARARGADLFMAACLGALLGETDYGDELRVARLLNLRDCGAGATYAV
ncbi:MAG: hypothetical protein HY825_09515 [Acidobacteria bacterium]|nr:hypothetical protein [Acidobacteriota bacterium]